MSEFPADWDALCVVMLLLGMRHGLDADHLAVIDGLTRVSARQRRPHARYCGALFSLGHGAVVLAVALLAGLLGAQWVPPAWAEVMGAAVSIGFLALIGIVNLAAVWRAAPGSAVPLVGVRGRLVERLLGGVGPKSGPMAVLGVGALFALSFDTLSQSALFAMLALQFGGVEQALMLGGLFALGMLVADGANGWWISRLIAHTDRLAVLASRVMTVAVAGVSLLVAAMGAARLLNGRIAHWSDGKELALSGGVIALVTLAYLVACRMSRLRAPVQTLGKAESDAPR